MDPVITFNLDDIDIHVEAEAGMHCMDYSVSSQNDQYEQKDHNACVVGLALFNFALKHSLSGTVVGAMTWAIGADLAIANAEDSVGGIDGGTIILLTVAITRKAGEAKSVSLEAIQYLGLTVAAE